jgi:hypothetical protein
MRLKGTDYILEGPTFLSMDILFRLVLKRNIFPVYLGSNATFCRPFNYMCFTPLYGVRNTGGKCVSSMKKCIFISSEKCICTVFCEFFKFIFDCTCTFETKGSHTSIIVCPGWPISVQKNCRKVVYCTCLP